MPIWWSSGGRISIRASFSKNLIAEDFRWSTLFLSSICSTGSTGEIISGLSDFSGIIAVVGGIFGRVWG